MSNPFFRFKQFAIYHDRCAMKVTTDGCLFGAWVADESGKADVDSGHTVTGPRSFLDIGTGTGLLSLMVAQKNTGFFEAVEIDPAAAEQARENIIASSWRNSIAVTRQDVLHWQNNRRYDVIFSNPPFYENELRATTSEKNIAHHDAGLTLPDLFGFIHDHLEDKGFFYLLLPTKRQREVEELLQKYLLFPEQKVHVQQTLKHQPFRLMIQGRRKNVTAVKESTLAIKGSNDQYTPEFISLLKDYYLYL